MSIQQSEVSVIIPAFNEEATIDKIVAAILKLYPEFEVIVVDDGSNDETASKAEGEGAKVVRHPYNIGNGAAVKTGIRSATRDYVVLMDGDGQHDPNDIKKLLKEAETYDLVVGARTSEGQASMGRRIANWCYNKFASYIAKFQIEDLTSGFRVFRRNTILKYLSLFPNTFSYPSTSTLAYLRTGRTVKYVPIVVHRRKGKSKIKLFQDGILFILIITRIATIYSPFRIFLPISTIFFVIGLCYYLYTFITIHRFTNMSALLFSMSVMVFLLGLISEQITQLRYDNIEIDDE